MKQARVYVGGVAAGKLMQLDDGTFQFNYDSAYQGPPVSLTMPVMQNEFHFANFPPFFEGLLPEGKMLDAILRRYKLDKNDFFAQLLKVGEDVVGAVTIKAIS